MKHIDVSIPIEDFALKGDLTLPDHPIGLVLFAHGSGSARSSPRNQMVAKILNDAGIATLLFDLLTEIEEETDSRSAKLRFDIDLLANRLLGTTKWTKQESGLKGLPIAYFGASTGAAAALIAAAKLPHDIRCVVSRGGRPDLANRHLSEVRCPVLLLTGELDFGVIELNQAALEQLDCEKNLQIISGATHLFEEPGKLGEAAELARSFFVEHFK